MSEWWFNAVSATEAIFTAEVTGWKRKRKKEKKKKKKKKKRKIPLDGLQDLPREGG